MTSSIRIIPESMRDCYTQLTQNVVGEVIEQTRVVAQNVFRRCSHPIESSLFLRDKVMEVIAEWLVTRLHPESRIVHLFLAHVDTSGVRAIRNAHSRMTPFMDREQRRGLILAARADQRLHDPSHRVDLGEDRPRIDSVRAQMQEMYPGLLSMIAGVRDNLLIYMNRALNAAPQEEREQLILCVNELTDGQLDQTFESMGPILSGLIGYIAQLPMLEREPLIRLVRVLRASSRIGLNSVDIDAIVRALGGIVREQREGVIRRAQQLISTENLMGVELARVISSIAAISVEEQEVMITFIQAMILNDERPIRNYYNQWTQDVNIVSIERIIEIVDQITAIVSSERLDVMERVRGWITRDPSIQDGRMRRVDIVGFLRETAAIPIDEREALFNWIGIVITDSMRVGSQDIPSLVRAIGQVPVLDRMDVMQHTGNWIQRHAAYSNDLFHPAFEAGVLSQMVQDVYNAPSGARAQLIERRMRQFVAEDLVALGCNVDAIPEEKQEAFFTIIQHGMCSSLWGDNNGNLMRSICRQSGLSGDEMDAVMAGMRARFS